MKTDGRQYQAGSEPVDEAARIAQETGQYDEQTGDALADDLDGALDCLYTKAMRGRDLNGPDAYAISQAYDLVRRHLTASGVPYVPEELKLVPVEPTREMLKAGNQKIRDFYSERGEYPRTRAMWNAMIAAAPTDGR